MLIQRNSKLKLLQQIIKLKYSHVFKRYIKPGTLHDFAANTVERRELEKAIKNLEGKDIQIPLVIGNQRIFSGDRQVQRMPYNHKTEFVKFCYANKKQINAAIKDGMEAQSKWHVMDVEDRAKVFLKCADMLEKEKKYYELLAAIMMGQGKTAWEAEVDIQNLLHNLRYIFGINIYFNFLKLLFDMQILIHICC